MSDAKKRKALEQMALKIFSHKGPVNIQRVQKQANQAYTVFEHLLTEEEKEKISIARGHSELGEGRKEFDNVMAKIRERLA